MIEASAARAAATGAAALVLACMLTAPAAAATPCGGALRRLCNGQSFEPGYRCLARHLDALSEICRTNVKRRVDFERSLRRR